MTALDAGPVVSLPLRAPEVATAWRQLERSGAVDSPFDRWAWVSALVGAGVDDGMEVLLCGPPERPLGLLLLQTEVDGPLRLRTIGPAGWRWLSPDHVEVVAPLAGRPSVAEALVAHLGRHRSWDVLDLDGVRAGGALEAAVGRLRPPRFLRLPPQPVLSPHVDLRRGSTGRLFESKNLRKQLGRGLRVAQELGGGLEVVDDPERVSTLLPELMRLHSARFGAASQVFATSERRRFHVLAARQQAEEGRARVYRLFTAARDAALLYVLLLGDRAYAYAIGMDPDVGFAPGRTVYGQALLSAAEEGLSEFDLLRGDHEFKLRFASGVREDRRVRVGRAGPRLAAAGVVRLRRRRRPPPS